MPGRAPYADVRYLSPPHVPFLDLGIRQPQRHYTREEELHMTGIYAMFFTGTAGSGYAVFVMKDGVIAGADPLGVQLNGTYHDAGDGKIDVAVSLTVPSGTPLVTGAIAGQEPMLQEIKATLPQTFADGNAVAVQTLTGPINVIFKYLRDIP